jgi:GxxExxY protein
MQMNIFLKILLTQIFDKMEKKLSDQIIEAALEVHRLLKGPGLLETVYETALCHELSLRGIPNQRQIPIPVTYKNCQVREPLFLDILVENKVIIEVKATGKDYPIYQTQLLTYLRLASIKFGLLINFGKEDLKDGIYPVLNNH